MEKGSVIVSETGGQCGRSGLAQSILGGQRGHTGPGYGLSDLVNESIVFYIYGKP